MADKLVAIDDQTGAMSPLVKTAFEGIVDDVASPYVSQAQSYAGAASSSASQARADADAAGVDADAAAQSAADANATAEHVDQVMTDAAGQIRAQVESDADRAVQAATDASGSADTAGTKAGEASQSAADADVSEQAAVQAATDAGTARDQSQQAAADAQAAVDSFDLTATATTLAPGSSATATVTGGPVYAVDIGVPRGNEGPEGPQGPQGETGTGLELSGRLPTYGDLPGSLGAGDAGRAYLVDADGLVYIWDGTAWPTEGSGEAIVGPKGDTGAPGDPGPKGDAGSPGPTNVLTIGTVSDGGAADATITGTSPNQVLNLTLPEGPKGDRGAPGQKGDTGDRGVPGDPGPANSLSIGTVDSGSAPGASITGQAPDQTLNLTLEKGPKGDTGEQGIQGPQGEPGSSAWADITGKPSTFPADLGAGGAAAYDDLQALKALVEARPAMWQWDGTGTYTPPPEARTVDTVWNRATGEVHSLVEA
ncbi:collagen-like protein [Tomitella gaofuii]|uniref:collagen-like protein n=1 Tax=Tomitella gaofuii TaxID=2760083 RepID=UPI0015FBF636|nr:collagen-like protein [Tomitella gaofuii]